MTRDINIHPVLNGFIVTVGCQSVVFDNVDKLIEELREYCLKPEVTEKRYTGFAINRDLMNTPPPTRSIDPPDCICKENVAR